MCSCGNGTVPDTVEGAKAHAVLCPSMLRLEIACLQSLVGDAIQALRACRDEIPAVRHAHRMASDALARMELEYSGPYGAKCDVCGWRSAACPTMQDAKWEMMKHRGAGCRPGMVSP